MEKRCPWFRLLGDLDMDFHELTDEEAGQVIKAVFDLHARGEVKEDFEPLPRLVYKKCVQSVLESQAAYEKKILAGRAGGNQKEANRKAQQNEQNNDPVEEIEIPFS